MFGTAILIARQTSLRCTSTDRKSTRLNSSHLVISYAVFCLKKKNLEILRRGKIHLAARQLRPPAKTDAQSPELFLIDIAGHVRPAAARKQCCHVPETVACTH